MQNSILAPLLESTFGNCLLASEAPAMFRCERSYEGTTRSIYFFQSVDKLPSNEELSTIQEQIIAPYYFKAPRASRWNHYLVFVTDDDKVSQKPFERRKLEIERNKEYTRKFVIPLSELDRLLLNTEDVIQPKPPQSQTVERWTTILAEAGLSKIQGNFKRAPLIRDIKAGKVKPIEARNAQSVASQPSQANLAPFIRSLTIEKFGQRSISGTFNFGRVNLIRGPNGTGKTSLLETIEHFFCGATFRAGGKPEILEAVIGFSDNSQESYKKSSNADYQKRDLLWYGHTVNRGNRLYEGFARFNFLNTDAAAHFALDEDLKNLKKSLSKIALGPDAAHTWNRLDEFSAAIQSEMRPIRTQASTLEAQSSTNKARLKALTQISPQADAYKQKADYLFEKIGWSKPPESVASIASWYSQLDDLKIFSEAFENAGQPRSLALSRELQDSLARDSSEIEQLIQKLKKSREQARRFSTRSEALQSTEARISRLQTYVDCNFKETFDNFVAYRDVIASSAGQVTDKSDIDELEKIARDFNCLEKDIEFFQRSLKEKLGEHQIQLDQVIEQLEEANARTKHNAELLADIHRLGKAFAENHPEAHECPLCKTPMGMTELVLRLENFAERAVTENNGTDLSSLRLRASTVEVELQRIRSSLAITEALNASFPTWRNDKVCDLINEARQIRERVERAQTSLAQTKLKLTTLQNAGHNIEEYSSILRELGKEFEIDVEPVRKGQDLIALFSTNYKHKLAALGTDRQAIERESSVLSRQEGEIREKFQFPEHDLEELSSQVHHDIKTLTELIDSFSSLPPPVKERHADNWTLLQDLVVDGLRLAENLNRQIKDEHARNDEIASLSKKIERDDEEIEKLQSQSSHLKAALKVIHQIQEHHSIEEALSDFLSENLSAIQSIFSRIHSPHELRLVSLADCTMERLQTENTVDFTQISTGQRAALVLSVFLSLNLSQRSGPPYILIDDPIAHIDDLNSLSFLDFLADVSEKGQRQIFFATADEKLGNLFEKKMAFLQHEFVSIDLTKHSSEDPRSNRH